MSLALPARRHVPFLLAYGAVVALVTFQLAVFITDASLQSGTQSPCSAQFVEQPPTATCQHRFASFFDTARDGRQYVQHQGASDASKEIPSLAGLCILQVDSRSAFSGRWARDHNGTMSSYEDGEHLEATVLALWINYIWAARNSVRYLLYQDAQLLAWDVARRAGQRRPRSSHWKKVRAIAPCTGPDAHALARHAQVPALLQVLQTEPACERVLYLDSDAYIRASANELTRVLSDSLTAHGPLGTAPAMALAHDIDNAPNGALNTGMIILRRCPEAERILVDWYAAPSEGPPTSARSGALEYDQPIFNAVVVPAHAAHIRALALSELNGPEGRLIRHLWGALSSPSTVAYVRKNMLSNVLHGLLAEQTLPCLDEATVSPDPRVSIDERFTVQVANHDDRAVRKQSKSTQPE
jgi:hypothetical protein